MTDIGQPLSHPVQIPRPEPLTIPEPAESPANPEPVTVPA